MDSILTLETLYPKPFQELLIFSISAILSSFFRFLKNSLENDLKSIKSSEVLSVDEFVKNEQNIKKDIVIIGSYHSKHNYGYDCLEHEAYIINSNIYKNIFTEILQQYVLNHFSKCIIINPHDLKSTYNFRNFFFEKLNPMTKFFTNPSFLSSLNIAFNFARPQNLLIFNDCISTLNHTRNNLRKFSINEDMVGLFVKANQVKKGNSSEIRLSPSILFQGNKNTCINYIKRDLKVWSAFFKISNSIVLLGVLRIGVYFIMKIFNRLYQDTNMPSNNNQQMQTSILNAMCSKCNIHTANIVILECNHFNLCKTCFEEEKRMCRICKIPSDNFLVIKINKNLK